MAAVWSCKIQVLDGEGQKGNISFYLLGTLTAAQVAADVESIAESAAGLMIGAIVGATATLQLDISGWTVDSSPDAQSNREYKGRFLFATADAFISRVSIPTLAVAAVVPNSELLDLGVGEPATAFRDLFLTLATTDERGTALTVLNKAYEVFGQ